MRIGKHGYGPEQTKTPKEGIGLTKKDGKNKKGNKWPIAL